MTPDMITSEALRILHQKCNFIGSLNRAYDASFAKEGAKIGDTLRIRLPNQYTVRTGATLSAQNTVETNTSLTVATQRGVDLQFTSVDLTMRLDDFSARILEPAMAVLAANIEADAFNMHRDVYNTVNNVGAAITFRSVMQARKRLNDSLAPMDDNRSVILNTQDNVDLVDALKGLFQDTTAIKQQYRDGSMGRTGGFEFWENTLIPTQTTGTAASTTGYLSNGATQSGSTIVVDTGTTTFAIGDVITFAGVFEVHPETKVSTGNLQQFVVTAAAGPSATSLAISPAVVATGARQNVSNTIADNSAITKVGGASAVYRPSLAFHKDAFTFATADLVLPKGVDMAARKVMDGISMRMVRQYDINNDRFPVRFDVLYGYRTIRPELACRILSN
ncbi:MAG: hypothetical protein ING29_11345 [Azospirillum sp.]|nr:hypothetical protein [Azospirillum sp.]